MEIYLLSYILTSSKKSIKAYWEEVGDARDKTLKYTDAFLDLAGRNSFAVYSTRRQIIRYTEWYGQIADFNLLLGLAEELFNKFPEDVEEAWK